METTAVNQSHSPIDPVARDLERLRDTTGKVVGSVFFGTMLKAMRESSIKGPYGHGGRGEEVFGAQLHAIYADRLGNATNKGLHDALFRTLERQQRAISETALRQSKVAAPSSPIVDRAAKGTVNLNA